MKRAKRGSAYLVVSLALVGLVGGFCERWGKRNGRGKGERRGEKVEAGRRRGKGRERTDFDIM